MKYILMTLLCTNSFLSYASESQVICYSQSKQPEITQSVKWYRDSAEKKALYNQTYAEAGSYVVKFVHQHQLQKKAWGVILDIDETVLDNSWYALKCGQASLSGLNFNHYIAIPQKSVALPGAVQFINLVHQLGGYVSLVSNRDGSYSDNSGRVIDATIANLKHENIYFDQVVLANGRDSHTPKDKNPRFNAINTGQYNDKEMVWSNKLPAHKVIAYVGDNIQDFPNLKQTTMNDLSPNDSGFNVFGNGYFILPNPIYGSWQDNEYK